MADGPRRRILIVEDHVSLLRLLSKCLQQAGYDVMAARNTHEAIGHLAEVVPDVIVSDIMMPGPDGYALVQHVRSNPRTDLIPIVFLTAKASRLDRIRSLRAGVDAYLTKPFEPEELVASIQNILARVRLIHRRVAGVSPSVGPIDVAPPTPVAGATITPAPRDGDPVTAGKPVLSELTETEQRIAQLVAQSLTNKEIASTLGISYRTVETHISHILSKKNLVNRVELALFVAHESQGRRASS
jgi:DNA-binding NarL/FixJ family response regulator